MAKLIAYTYLHAIWCGSYDACLYDGDLNGWYIGWITSSYVCVSLLQIIALTTEIIFKSFFKIINRKIRFSKIPQRRHCVDSTL